MPISQKLRCAVDRIVAHGDRVYTLVLKPERPAPRFRAGEFLHLALDPYDPSGFWPDSRVFSIASSPMNRSEIRITYSVHGAFSQRMEREISEGARVWIKMPYGDFVIQSERNIVLFAGGTGVTAFTAFLEQLPATSSTSVILAYGARTDRLLIYRDVVDHCVQRASALKALYFAEQLEHPATTPTPSIEIGRLSVAAVWPRLQWPLDADYYISGPPAMLRDIECDLRAERIQPEAIHIDAWE